jgi:hypothetical protein
MATTTNYGWTTPDDTALVKDGAAAIRTLGSSVDTTTKNLNPETTLGDISFRSSTSNVNTRLGIGTTGQVLNVAGGVPAWTTISSGGMTLLSTTTLSGTSTTISSISSAYTDLVIIGKNIVLNTGDDIFYQFNGQTGTIYQYQGVWNTNGTITGTNITGLNRAQFAVGGTTSGYSDESRFITHIPRYSSAEIHELYSKNYARITANSSRYYLDFFGTADISAAISSVTILTNGATFSSGTVYIYGVK